MPPMPFGALGVVAEVDEHDRDDLAEPQGHDREVVAAKPQRRGAEHDPEHGRHAAPTMSIGQNGNSLP